MFNIQKILIPVVFADTSRQVALQAALAGAPLSCGDRPAPRSNASRLSRRRAGGRARDHRAGFARAHRPAGPAGSGSGAADGSSRGSQSHGCLVRGDPAREIVNTVSRDQNVDLDRDADARPWGLLSLSVGIGDGEGAARMPVPCLDRRSPGRGAGGRVLDPPRSLLGGFERSQPPHRVAGRRAGRGRRGGAYAHDAYHGGLGVLGSRPGSFVDPTWKEAIAGACRKKEVAKLQEDLGTKADVVIDSGNVAELLNQAAERTNADVLVIGHFPGHSHLGDNGAGYGIIRESRIPVLCV